MDFGYLHDPSIAEGHPFSEAEGFTADLKYAVDLSAHCTESNQYWAGSCVGNATADAIEVLDSLAGRPKVQLSRLFVYSMARLYMDANKDGRPDIDRDNGTYIPFAMKALCEYGICPEEMWPYNLEVNLYKRPSIMAMAQAAGHKIGAAYQITEVGSERVVQVIRALSNDHPVVFATTVTKSFQHCKNADPLFPTTVDSVGGHAMLIVGYDPDKGFLVKNSWGADWGANGFCWMDVSFIMWSQTKDLWVPTRTSNLPFSR